MTTLILHRSQHLPSFTGLALFPYPSNGMKQIEQLLRGFVFFARGTRPFGRVFFISRGNAVVS
jgi:hypothetical protein